MNNQNIDLAMFVDRLIEEKKFPAGLEKEVMDQIKADLLSRVEDRVNAVIIANLAPDKLEEFSQKLDGDISDEEMQKFCAENIPDLPQILASELLAFKQSYLS
jgi:hypothetical protein